MQAYLFCKNSTALNEVLSTILAPYSKVFILVDSHTAIDCLPILKIEKLVDIITIPASEENKNSTQLLKIWEVLTTNFADRKSVLINLGGGMITDIGGFAASCYKRGIDFINIPTTILAQVDASIGGKTGIDFAGYKNQIGAFSFPIQTIIAPLFLDTLPQREYKSGIAEMLKHYLIADENAFTTFVNSTKISDEQIENAIAIKLKFVEADPMEKNIRKALNFGHTIGHAIESFLLNKNEDILHGEAVAAGMICESFIAYKKGLITIENLVQIKEKIDEIFPLIPIHENDFDAIIGYALQDKKNENSKVNFTLINGIGDYLINQTADSLLMKDALKFYGQ